jgi:hypothetical protein
MENVELSASLVMADMLIDLVLGNDECLLTLTDTGPTGGQATIACSPEQAAAVFYLAIAGDRGNEEMIAALYELAEPLVGHLPQCLRPIP